MSAVVFQPESKERQGSLRPVLRLCLDDVLQDARAQKAKCYQKCFSLSWFTTHSFYHRGGWLPIRLLRDVFLQDFYFRKLWSRRKLRTRIACHAGGRPPEAEVSFIRHLFGGSAPLPIQRGLAIFANPLCIDDPAVFAKGITSWLEGNEYPQTFLCRLSRQSDDWRDRPCQITCFRHFLLPHHHQDPHFVSKVLAV